MSAREAAPTLEERRAYCGRRDVTLNGNRAVIGGARLDFARVTDMTTGLSAEWSWHAVRRILDRDGRFTS